MLSITSHWIQIDSFELQVGKTFARGANFWFQSAIQRDMPILSDKHRYQSVAAYTTNGCVDGWHHDSNLRQPPVQVPNHTRRCLTLWQLQFLQVSLRIQEYQQTSKHHRTHVLEFQTHACLNPFAAAAVCTTNVLCRRKRVKIQYDAYTVHVGGQWGLLVRILARRRAWLVSKTVQVIFHSHLQRSEGMFVRKAVSGGHRMPVIGKAAHRPVRGMRAGQRRVRFRGRAERRGRVMQKGRQYAALRRAGQLLLWLRLLEQTYRQR